MTTREQAMQWWNNLCSVTQQLHASREFGERWASSLIENEIEEIWRKENIYLKRLREQYKIVKKQNAPTKKLQELRETDYQSIRLFCLDCSLLSFAEIEAMEYEVNQSF